MTFTLFKAGDTVKHYLTGEDGIVMQDMNAGAGYVDVRWQGLGLRVTRREWVGFTLLVRA